MEPKLTIYRIIMAAGLMCFWFSINENYFPNGFVCSVGAIFTAVYLWEELMCSTPSRSFARYEEPGIVGMLDPTFHERHNPELAKLAIYLILPFFVWHIMTFGMGYGLHKFISTPVVKEMKVAAVLEMKSRRGPSVESMKIKDMKTYWIFAVPIPKTEYFKIANQGTVSVKIDARQSIFGLSFPDNFQFKTIQK